jgi:hypothetical protein
MLIYPENLPAFFVSDVNITVTDYPKTVVKQTCGHAVASLKVFLKTQTEKACPLLLCNIRHAITG